MCSEKKKRLNLRLTEYDYELIEKEAKRRKVSKSDLFRSIIARFPTKEVIKDENEQLTDTTKEPPSVFQTPSPISEERRQRHRERMERFKKRRYSFDYRYLSGIPKQIKSVMREHGVEQETVRVKLGFTPNEWNAHWSTDFNETTYSEILAIVSAIQDSI
ncbi:ribbon-helix-helix protein, CopG family [Lusitaniella coriacea LEGE 07157]|uniref:Ribbon-helix-helix protein, CopG family n=1 Tax=Lusitaniella coriacea LEGE 07157 TaxID=945747 RepID=A0A8J7E3Q2_9CYAN|nr:CopG family transcriptional regulator [Lusitaniella coriacea]MBE9119127.1 ribbon-helix-helix protein, CopG family [Lusitaniella coriacea LEGE 07157]